MSFGSRFGYFSRIQFFKKLGSGSDLKSAKSVRENCVQKSVFFYILTAWAESRIRTQVFGSDTGFEEARIRSIQPDMKFVKFLNICKHFKFIENLRPYL